MGERRRWQRVAAYAVILRGDQILLSRLSPGVTRDELWTLPGGGVDHGEAPRDAVVREVHEETGLDAQVGETARVYSMHAPDAWRNQGRVDAHSIRIIYTGWVSLDAPQPRVVEVDGSTVDAAWHPVSAVLDGSLPVAAMVKEALVDHQPARLQRVAAYALVVRGDEVLLTRISARGFHTGSWTLPGGGIEHGESPVTAVVREVCEETGLTVEVGEVVAVLDERVRGSAPSGRDEDFHSIGLIYAATVSGGELAVEEGGTTDAVAWVPVVDIEAGLVPVTETVMSALRRSRTG
ncbi:MAG: NUDIX domain-containing protein [Nocardioides sp.]